MEQDITGEQIADILVQLRVTGISQVAVIEIVDRMVPSRQRRAVIEALTQPGFSPRILAGDTPGRVQTLLAALQRAGAEGIQLPRCPNCQRQRVLRRKGVGNTRICHRCAERRHYAECPLCERVKKLTQTNEHGTKICDHCAPGGEKLRKVCERCGRTVTVGSVLDGVWTCLNCYPKPTHKCVACGQQKKIASIILHGKHCFACHNRVLRNPRPCPRCEQNRILAFLDQEQQPVCAGCAGQPARYACRRCGGEEHFYGRDCGLCILDDRCREILARPDGTLSEPMEKLRRYLLAKPRPEQVIKWFKMSKSIPLLRSIAQGDTPLAEASFASESRNRWLVYLRDLLLDAGSMPREQTITRQLEAWVATTISHLTVERRQIVAAYVRWALLRRAKRDPLSGDITPGGATHVRVCVRGIITFLDWLDEKHTSLDTVTLTQIEAFMTIRSSHRWLWKFLTWAEEHELTPAFETPSMRKPAPNVTGIEQQHEKTIRHLASDNNIELDARFAGLLIAVYGLLATRTLRLRRNQLHITEHGEAELLLGEHPLVLAGPVAEIAKQHLATLEPARQGDWLFPGLSPGGHRDAQYLTSRLEPLGMSISELQKAARFRLAGNVPAKVLADALGFNTTTFEVYANLSASPRGDYPQLHAQ